MRRLGACALLALALACAPEPTHELTRGTTHADGASTPDAGPTRDEALATLRANEDALRAHTDWTSAPPGQRARGADPIAVARVGADRFAVALRGADAVLLVDARGVEVARAAGPAAARGLAVTRGGDLLVVGELDRRVFRYRVTPSRLDVIERVPIAGATAPRAIAVGDGARGEVFHVADRDAGCVLTVDARGAALGTLEVGAGALDVRRVGALVIAASVEGHRVVIAPVDARGAPDGARAVTLDNDGPFWALDAAIVDDALWVASAHVEDHALDRSAGGFRFIDSFVRVDALPRDAWRAHERPTPRRVLTLNASAHALVVPKALALTERGALVVAAAGSGQLATVDARSGAITSSRTTAPGAAALALLADDASAVLVANTLLDAVTRVDHVGVHHALVAAKDEAARAADERLGEALVFTTLMAPRQSADDGLSRFTCETCHFEGGGDGRVHSTGRMRDGAPVRATTKPLFGLANNAPLFTRALDASLTQMAHNEFRVANADSPQEPWFAAQLEDAPWLPALGVRPPLSPERMRGALVRFAFAFTHETSPRSAGRATFDADERAGAALFAARCERCHAARLVADDPRSAVPPARWEALTLSAQAPIVWARDGYERTGVEPRVHDDGARPSSLRRIVRKSPYFTNGSARTLDDVLAGARFDDATFLHAGERAGLRAFDGAELRALRAFLLLL